MTFLNPFLLFGLAAATIPIIIHLLNLRKLKTIEFSSIRFLKELQKTKMRRVKIRQILLLILRTLLIILIVLAFARPALHGSVGSIGARAKSTIVILLDDSPSMTVRDERGVLFSQATAAAANLLNVVKDGDELYFMRLSEVHHKDAFAASTASSVRAVLDKIQPSLETASFRDALGVTAKVLTESKNFNQEVYLVTDAQASQFTITGSRDSSNLFDTRMKFFIVETGKEQDNAGIASIDLKTQIMSKSKPVALKAIVRSFGNTPLRNSIMSVYVDGSRVVQQSLDIGARSSGTVDFTVVPKRRGVLRGYAQLEDDALEADNMRHFVIRIPDNINVLVVGGKPQDTRLASLALTLGGDSSLAGLFSALQTTQTQLSSLDINRFDVLVFCGVKEFTPTEADRIAQFVKAGGGIMIFPGDETNIINWNETLFAKLGIPASQAAQGELGTVDQSSFLSFDKLDVDHPLFQELFEQSTIRKKPAAAIESPRVFRSIKPQAGNKGHVIITLSDGSGFLTEYTSGAGRVLLYSVEADMHWSDFPIKGLFAPLLHRSTLYLAGHDQNASARVVGENIKASLRQKPSGTKTSYTFRSPGGMEEHIVPRASGASGTSLFESSATTETGAYELRNGDVVLDAFAVDVDPSESDLRHATNEELAAFWKHIGVDEAQALRVQASEKLETTVLESRLGVELWKYFLALAIAISLVEMAVARESKSSATAGAKQ